MSSSPLLQSRKRWNESCPSKVRVDRPVLGPLQWHAAHALGIYQLPCYPLIILSFKQNGSFHDESLRHQWAGTLFYVLAKSGIFQQSHHCLSDHLDQAVVAPFSFFDSKLLPIPYQTLLNTRSRNAGNLKSNQLILLRLCKYVQVKSKSASCKLSLPNVTNSFLAMQKNITNAKTPASFQSFYTIMTSWNRWRECRDCSIKRDTWSKISPRKSSKSIAHRNIQVRFGVATMNQVISCLATQAEIWCIKLE